MDERQLHNMHMHWLVFISTISFIDMTYNPGKGSVSCVTKTCEKKTCQVGFVLETAHGVSDTCCPHQVCVPAASQCQELVEPTCGEFQEVKTVLGSDNCPRYVCGKRPPNNNHLNSMVGHIKSIECI